MTNVRKVPEKLIKMRKRLKKMEQEQEERKMLIQQLSEAEQLQEDLLVAIQSGSLSRCRDLLERGVDVNHNDIAG